MIDRKFWWMLGATVLALVGSVICILAGWAGVRDEPSVAAQIPYVVTGGGFGIILMIAAAALGSAVHRELVYQTLRQDVAVLQDQVDEVLGSVGESSQSAPTSADGPSRRRQTSDEEYAGDGYFEGEPDGELAEVGAPRRRPLRAAQRSQS
jgi:hypothetical protein